MFERHTDRGRNNRQPVRPVNQTKKIKMEFQEQDEMLLLTSRL